MRRRWLLALVALLFASGQHPALACSCVPFTKPQLIENAAVIFTGVVTGGSRQFSFGIPCSVSSADPVTFSFDVETVYKGDVPKATAVTTVVGGASCGYEFVSGRRYTVFGTSAGGKLETNLCRGNVEGAIDPSEYGLGPGHAPLAR
ncbi:MAG TPA: hypothetical protein VEP48_07745 [Methylomirabilota bacterium]|nr:hypothetical protein [Methylomirabilota bacterium]